MITELDHPQVPFTTDEIARLRADTPACERHIHFDNAGSSLMPDPVFEAVRNHLELEREFGGYTAAAKVAPLLAGFYDNLAALLGAASSEIAYAESATRAWDMAFHSIAWTRGDRILTHSSEYGSNYLSFLHLARRSGVEIDFAPSNENDQVDVDALAAAITPRTKLIAITHVPMHEGVIQPVGDIGRIARTAGVLFLLDACQAVGQLAVNVKEIGCHILAGTGRKYLRGPRGTGFLYVSSDIGDQLKPPFVDMRAAKWTAPDSYELMPGAKRFEAFESSIASRIGLATAAAYAHEIGMPRIEERIRRLADQLRDVLGELDGIEVHDRGNDRSGIVTFTKSGVAAVDMADRLEAAGITISIARREQAWRGLGARGLDEVIRASVHVFNTENEISRFCDVVSSI